MSFTLRTASRTVPRLARGYATPYSVSEAAGVKVASSSEPSTAAAAISVVVNAGSRYESQPGLAHVLKNSLFKGTNKRSAIRIVRETEFLGGVLSTTLSREHITLTAEFLNGQEAYFAEILGDALTQAKLAAHEYNEEVIPQVAADYEQSISNAAVHALDVAHNLAFRTGLGNSLFASPHNVVDHQQAKQYAQSAFSANNFAVIGAGIESGVLQNLVGQHFAGAGKGSALSTPSQNYFGGELRLPAVHGHGQSGETFVLAFKGAAKPDSSALYVLQHLLGGESAVKWSTGSTPLAKITENSLATAKAFNLSYSDAGLFGILIQAKEGEIESIAQKVVQELKRAAKGVSEESVKAAIARAKFETAAALETRSGSLEVLGAQLASTGKTSTVEEVFASLDKVTPDAVAKAAAAALKSAPTTVAVGNTRSLPYADTLGL